MKKNIFFSLLLLVPFATHTAVGGADELNFLQLTLETQMTFLENPSVGEQLEEPNLQGYRVATQGDKPGLILETQEGKFAMTYRRGEFSDRETNVEMFQNLLTRISSCPKELKNKTDIIYFLNEFIKKSPTRLKSESNFAFLAHLTKQDPSQFAFYYDAAVKASMSNDGKGTELIIPIEKKP